MGRRSRNARHLGAEAGGLGLVEARQVLMAPGEGVG